mgnify:CR=1 FL=1
MLVKITKVDSLFSDSHLEAVAVIGGGRWARVLLEVLCSVVPGSIEISAHSPRNSHAMSEWVLGSELENRIQVYSDYPKVVADKKVALIVVNAARDHEKAIEWALSKQLPVLVEKPVTLSFSATQRMAELAIRQDTYFAAAHVFLFASYIESFSRLILSQKNIVSIRVFWSDPTSERRYGESKNYDAGLPVYADWLPHILSILGSFMVGLPQLRKNILFMDGGSRLNIKLFYEKIPCSIELIRNGKSRKRIFEVSTEQQKHTLDFGVEPGVIYTDSNALPDNPDWSDEPGPVAKMLSAFLQGVACDVRDQRLDISIGLSSGQLIDQVGLIYRDCLFYWLNEEFHRCYDDISISMNYALTELLTMHDSDSVVPVDQRIMYIYQHLKDLFSIVSDESSQYIEHAIELIIEQGKNSSYS